MSINSLVSFFVRVFLLPLFLCGVWSPGAPSSGVLQMLLMVQAQEVTEAPAAAAAGPNECDQIDPGDIYFTYLRALEPDEVVLFAFEDIPGDMKLYLTDNAWTGRGFQADEGTLELTTPAEGIPQGSNFGYGPNPNYGRDWLPVEGAFALNPQGEQLFLYCVGATDIVPLAAISYNGPWQEAGLPSYGLNESALPDRLETNGTITLEHCDQWEYSGTRSANVDVLKQSMQNVNNWKGEGCTGTGGSGAASPSRVLMIVVSMTVGLLGSIWIY